MNCGLRRFTMEPVVLSPITHKSLGISLSHYITVIVATLALSTSHAAVAAEGSARILPAGQLPNDSRLQPLKNLKGYFPFHVPESPEAWEKRRDELRRRILVASGLWPMPRKTPLNAVIHDRTERDDFTVDKVYFESIPGHYVTGLLFRPKDAEGKRPAVLCPHGHWGRQHDHGPKKIRELIVEGRERFEQSGRFPKLARCAQLARMGCVAFIYDMLGYADSRQIPNGVAHDLRKPRPHLDTPERWGLFTTQAELRLQSSLGLQLINSIRGLDFLCSLPDVDPGRLAVTGNSGGGTQTFLLCAVDQRPIAAFPQGMVSTAMQGGCLCENACLLRIGTGNVELAAIFAPKPMAMTAADDWTIEMMSSGYPELMQLYEMLGAKDNVFCKKLVHFPHNYNYVTRAVMYRWLNKHLQLGLEDPIVEEDYELLSEQERTVWSDEHPAPTNAGEEHEVSLTKWWDNESQQLLAEIYPHDSALLARYRETIGGAFNTIIGRHLPPPGAVVRKKIGRHDWGKFLELNDLLRYEQHGEEVPAVWLYPTEQAWNGELVIWVDGEGKQALFRDAGVPREEVSQLLSNGFAVASLDLFMQGEFLSTPNPPDVNRLVKSTRSGAGFTFGYNHAVFVQRVHDIISLVAVARDDERKPKIHLVGVNGAGPIVTAAGVQLGPAVSKRVIDTRGFRFGQLGSVRDINFVPGAVKYGDLPAMLALSAPHPLWISGEGKDLPGLVHDVYQACSADKNLHNVPGDHHNLVTTAFFRGE